MKRVKPLVILILAAACVFAITYRLITQAQKAGFKPCQGIPAQIPAKLVNGSWTADLKTTPTNAPCYIDITATAVDNYGNTQTSQSIRIYIKKR